MASHHHPVRRVVPSARRRASLHALLAAASLDLATHARSSPGSASTRHAPSHCRPPRPVTQVPAFRADPIRIPEEETHHEQRHENVIPITPDMPEESKATTDILPAVPAPRRLRLPSPLVAGSTAAVLAFVGLGTVTFLQHQDLTRTDKRLIATRATLAETKDDLTETKASLEKSRADLATAQGRLGAAERDVDDARADAAAKQKRIADLNASLVGLSHALSYAADDYWGLAVSALESVEAPCKRAQAESEADARESTTA